MSEGSGKLGLKEVVAMGVGGMVSGGIYAVLGVAMDVAGNAVPLSFLIAGVIALLTGYSYIKLTNYYGEGGGSFTFIEKFVKDKKIAGIVGWTLLFGYIGTMAMYAYGFGAYTAGLLGFGGESILRKFLSLGIIAAFIGINFAGVKKSGFYEDIAVYIKVVILTSIAVLGILLYQGDITTLNFFNKGVLSPIAAFAIIFVAFEGFQLLTYDYKDIKNVKKNLPRGIAISILISTIIYVLVSFMATLHLSAEQVIASKEYALAQATIPFLGMIGFAIVSISAINSTSSGLNATLFGSARLTWKMAKEKDLPKFFSFKDKRGIPEHSLLVVGALTILFSVFGTLEGITSFASIVFLIIFAVVNFANLKLRKKTGSKPYIPLMGLFGCLMALPIIIRHLFLYKPEILLLLGVMFSLMFTLEFVFIKRDLWQD